MTPQDLITAITRAVADDATLDDRRAGRRAAMLLAGSLGEPGEAMHLGASAPSARPRVDGAQLMDVAIAKMRAFLNEQSAKTKTAPPGAVTSSGSSTEVASTRARWETPPLHIPLVGGRRSQ